MIFVLSSIILLADGVVSGADVLPYHQLLQTVTRGTGQQFDCKKWIKLTLHRLCGLLTQRHTAMTLEQPLYDYSRPQACRVMLPDLKFEYPVPT